MKAWVLSDRRGNNPCYSLVWADTAGKAKSLAHSSNGYMYQSDLEAEKSLVKRSCITIVKIAMNGLVMSGLNIIFALVAGKR